MDTPGESPASLQFVLVDLAGTLIEPDPEVSKQYRALAQQRLPDSEIPALDTIKRRFRTSFTHLDPPPGELRYGTTRSEGLWFWKRVVGSVFVRVNDDRLQSLTEALFEHFGRASAWRVLPGARDVLTTLGRAGIQRALVSNWDVRGRSLVNSLGLKDCFEALGFSSEEGVEKPDRRFFERLMDRLEVSDPSRGLMVGNSPHRDLNPARELGLRTCLMGSEDSGKHPQVESWGALHGRMSRFPEGFG